MQAFAKPAYLSGFLYYALPHVAGCCVPGGVRVVSNSVRLRGSCVHLSGKIAGAVALIHHRLLPLVR